MPRIARIVIPGCPHHVIQRGNRKQQVFFSNSDRTLYLRLLKKQSARAGMEILAYCLMDNHVHLVSIPRSKNSFVEGLAEVHRKFTTIINIREDWRGFLWQGRFLSYPLDEAHCYAAIRYVENNPVRAGLVSKAEDFRWSSAPAHVRGTKDPILAFHSKIMKIKNWTDFLGDPVEEKTLAMIRKHEKSGRPLGGEIFLAKIEKMTGARLLSAKKRMSLESRRLEQPENI
jgi:putative transposase